MRRTELFIESLFAMRRLGDSIPLTYSLRLDREMVNVALENIEPVRLEI